MELNFNPSINLNKINFRANQVQRNQATQQPDVFVPEDKKTYYMKELDRLFPNGELDKIYNSMGKELGIDYQPNLHFVGEGDGIMAGGYTFSQNKIFIDLQDLLGHDTKILGVKNGIKKQILSPSDGIPLFIKDSLAQPFIEMHNRNGSLGYEKLITEPLSDEDKRKFTILKLNHELVHAQQHMIMRQTEGIGTKKILQAWVHLKPATNLVAQKQIDNQTNEYLKKTFWADKSDNIKIPKNSPAAAMAYIWLDAVQNYPPVDSPEYKKNALENHAYQQSYQYIVKNYNGW